ncbi:DoxX family protein [Streptomyces sp. NPDC006975]|uniref:DoxX family protein n=1 Tax=Streptomyces albus (strain ATCC 21838 / DSM 41398 / FERM P-419 / JCM 4703 / NBRC 107858) TaxID=1081613 RepID=A0A0B5ES98_STRA4|nr:DoxX family protein [Streptomyces albus]AOU75931.1 DoxX family protein [Streptomyces albus]AYN31737.1 DoxX family protein [Streptomyces albus]
MGEGHLTTQLSTWQAKLTATSAPAATVLIRLYVGAVFLSEGILKFLRPDAQGTGRFDKAGIPAPGFFAPLDGVFEITCGLLILAGLLTRLAAAPMIVDMVGALLITKLPILWGDAPLFAGKAGWWDFAHESRTDLAQLCGSLFLLLVGAGALSLDARRQHTGASKRSPQPALH